MSRLRPSGVIELDGVLYQELPCPPSDTNVLRRVFTAEGGDQLLVTVDGDRIEVVTRRQTWDRWGPPLPFDYADDKVRKGK